MSADKVVVLNIFWIDTQVTQRGGGADEKKQMNSVVRGHFNVLVVVKSSMNINRIVVTFLRRGTIKAESVFQPGETFYGFS